MNHTFNIREKIKESRGFIGISIRRQILGNKLWTMTAWEDEECLEEFVESNFHINARKEASDALVDSFFVRVPIKRKDIPISWEEAERRLKETNK